MRSSLVLTLLASFGLAACQATTPAPTTQMPSAVQTQPPVPSMPSITLIPTLPILSSMPVSSMPASETPAEVSSPAPSVSVPPTSAVPPTTVMRSITLSEVANHSTPSDCWLAIGGNVYNVSGNAEKHPGGEAIYEGCGKDATTLFETRPMGDGTPHSAKARSYLPNYLIGTLAS